MRNLESIQAVARKIGKQVLAVDARTAKEIDSAFLMMTQQNIDAVVVLTDAFFIDQRRQIAGLAARNRLPSISAFREYPEVGGLMSYGPSFRDSYRRAATYVDKILRGTKPGELPIEQPTIFELIINGTTAKALGLTIPRSLLIRADKVIE